jgi:hypothetical protein
VRCAVLDYWKALDGVALSVSVRRSDLELTLALAARGDGLPPQAGKLFADTGQVSSVWQYFPPDAILAVAGRLDAEATREFVDQFLSPEARGAVQEAVRRGAGAALGADVAKEVLPFLGPDWGMCVTAPPPGEAGWFPRVLWVLRVRPGPAQPPADKVLLSRLHAFAGLAVLAFNSAHSDPIALKVESKDGVEVRFITGGKQIPGGLRPAYAYRDGYLLLATSPDVIHEFGMRSKAPDPDADTPLLRISLTALRTFVKDREIDLVAHIAEREKISREESARRVLGLREVLRLLDRLELTQRFTPGQLSLTFRLRTAFPLEK